MDVGDTAESLCRSPSGVSSGREPSSQGNSLRHVKVQPCWPKGHQAGANLPAGKSNIAQSALLQPPSTLTGEGESCHDVSTWAALLPSSSQRFAGLCSVGASVRLRHQTAFSEKQHYKQWGRFPGLSTKAYFTGNIVATIFIGRHLKWNWLDFDRLVFALMRCAEESG